jgi:hypothetical protein
LQVRAETGDVMQTVQPVMQIELASISTCTTNCHKPEGLHCSSIFVCSRCLCWHGQSSSSTLFLLGAAVAVPAAGAAPTTSWSSCHPEQQQQQAAVLLPQPPPLTADLVLQQHCTRPVYTDPKNSPCVPTP